MNVLVNIILLFVVFFLLIYILVYMPIQEQKRITTKLKNAAKLHKVMARIRRETNIERILILSSHNGNGMPLPGSKIKVTAVDESYQYPFVSVVEKYNNLPVDGEYILMLDEVRMGGYTSFFTDDMPDHSLLKMIYRKEGVFWSYVVFLSWDKRNWYYASLATSKEKSPFQEGKRLEFELGLNDLKTTFCNSYDTPTRLLRRKYF